MGNTRDKQLGALGLCAFSVPAILFLPQMGWESVLLVTVAGILVVSFGRAVAGPTGKLLSLPLLLWNTLILGKLAWEISSVYGTDNPLPGLLLLLLAAYGVKKQAHPVVGAVLAFFLMGIYGILYLFALPNIELKRLIPERETEIWSMAYGFLPLLLLYMYKEEGRKQRFLWTGIGAVLALGAAMVTEGVGAENFYTAAKSVNLFGAMERLEPFVASAVTAGGFCLLGLILIVNENIWTGMWSEKKSYPVEFMILPSIAVCLVAPRIENEIWALGTTLCWGLIPVITQFVVYKKKL